MEVKSISSTECDTVFTGWTQMMQDIDTEVWGRNSSLNMKDKSQKPMTTLEAHTHRHMRRPWQRKTQGTRLEARLWSWQNDTSLTSSAGCIHFVPKRNANSSPLETFQSISGSVRQLSLNNDISNKSILSSNYDSCSRSLQILWKTWEKTWDNTWQKWFWEHPKTWLSKYHLYDAFHSVQC